MRRLSLGFQVFASILGVSLVTVATVGFFARTALSRAFDAYLATLPNAAQMRGRGMGRMMLGAAEQTFIAGVDRSVILSAVLAVTIGTVVAIILAAYLSQPLRRLEEAAEGVAAGDLAQRVDVDGPAEVAAIGEAFNRMAGSLQRAEDLRRTMVADVAHELRNPLAAARAQAEGMVDGIVPATGERLESLLEDLQHLSALIDDLQELAVAEAGRLRYDMDDIDPAQVVTSEAERARALLAPGVELKLAIEAEGLVVTADERRLSQVMRNLLSNAARHTKAGSVTVSLRAEEGRVVVIVSDTGEGIGDAELAHIFERFYRADQARAAHTGGAGLGLAISRSIVRDHGGDVFARSAPGEGSEIGFWLPTSS